MITLHFHLQLHYNMNFICISQTLLLVSFFCGGQLKHVKTTNHTSLVKMDFHCHVNYALGSHVDLTGITCVNKMQEIIHGRLELIESGSICMLNASRSYKLLYYFIYTSKVSQIHGCNLCKIYANVEIRHYSACMKIMVYLYFFQSR